MIDTNFYKQAERKIQEWLDRPTDGYCVDRVHDQLSGFYGSKNISDFTFFKAPNYFYIESKSTWEDRFNFSMITEYQHDEMLKKSKIDNVYGLVIVLFASYKRAFIINIKDIEWLETVKNKHSLNIKKVDSWGIPYVEIQTIPSRKELLDYTGDWNVEVIL